MGFLIKSKLIKPVNEISRSAFPQQYASTAVRTD